MKAEIFAAISDNIFGVYWIFLALGIAHALLQEKQYVLAVVLKKKGFQFSHPFFTKRLFFVIGGWLLAISAYLLTATTLSLLTTGVEFPENFPPFTNSIGLVSVSFFILAGVSLTLSAGSRWLVGLAKTALTFGLLYPFFAIIYALVASS